MFIHHFSVQGRGAFPLDMLRYDGCYPRSSEDVDGISLTVHNAREEYSKPRYVRLTRLGATKSDAERVTPGRWASFGWNVVISLNVSALSIHRPETMKR